MTITPKPQSVKTTVVAATILCCTLSLFGSAWAIEAVYKDADNIAINGYDPIAYHDQARPVAGKAAHAVAWNDAIWYFTNADNRARFMTNPPRWAPRYGGYCAWAVSHGYVAKTDPAAWRIVEGHLYLNYSLNVQARWAQDIPRNIRRADAHWPKLLDSRQSKP